MVGFSKNIGTDLIDYALMEDNRSLSLQATAILYVQKKFGAAIPPYANYDKDTTRVLDALRTLGGGTLLFGPDLLDPVLEKCAAEIGWMEKRLGVAIRDYPAEGADTISSGRGRC